MKTYFLSYRGGEIFAEVNAKSQNEAYEKILTGAANFQVNNDLLHSDFWELDKTSFYKNYKKQQYEIFINAKILSTLQRNQIEKQLVASLFDIETEIKIDDGSSQKFEVLDYNFTDVLNVNEY